MDLLRKSNLLYVAMILTIGLFSCSSDDESTGGGTPSETTTEEDEASIEQSLNNIESYATSLENSEMFKVMNDLIDEDDLTTKLLEGLIEEMEIEIPEEEGEIFQANYDTNKGKYTWNHANEEWDISAHQHIVINFPSSSTIQENDLTLTVSEYSETPSSLTGDDEHYFPTSLKANLLHHDEEVFYIDLTADYNNILPSYINFELFIKPITVSMNYNNTNDRDIFFSFSIEDMMGDQISMEHNVTVNRNSGGEWSEDDIESANGFLSINEVSYIYQANFLDFDIDEDTDADGLNNALDISIEINGHKKADIFFETDDETQGANPMVRFSDGTTKDLMEF